MGFISDLIGSKNNFKAEKPQGADYQVAIQKALNGLTGGSSNQARQGMLADNLMGAINGAGPSVAQSQLAQTTDANVAGTAGQIGSVAGINPALAARLIGGQGAAINQQAAGQGATLRAQEILGARDQLGGVLANGRAQDIGQVGTLGGLQNQQGQLALGADQINSGVAQANANTNSGIFGGILGNVAKLGAAALTGGASAASGAAPAAMSEGGKVPGEPEVEGDSPKNDTVPTMLSPGEGVLPLSVMDDPEEAADFARELVARGKGKKAKEEPKEDEPEGFAKVAKALKKLEDRMKKLEA